MTNRRAFAIGVAAAGLVAVFGIPAQAQHAPAFPTTLQLPNHFQPEGIAIGGTTGYFGSLRDGSVHKIDLRTGRGAQLSAPTGTPSVGLKIDKRDRLFIAGGVGGDARVVDARTGKLLAKYPLGGGFVNDVVLTEDAAYFTDSHKAVLYKLSLGRELPAKAETIPLGGEWVQAAGFNANGIETTPDGRSLLVINIGSGKLFRVDPRTGDAKLVDLGGLVLTNGDGLLRQGHLLYVVQNRINTLSAVRLDHTGAKGALHKKVTDPRFDVPTTVAAFGDRLYLPNARFGTEPGPNVTYNVVAVPRF
ncbi:superoxide dismutase [Allokutzneria sp. A3M-2-11 16]|uniref:SMP-30/gluconolactonase/LRE family protein n=1 Tax=Allokutzneria sp. A3M-2-11 16 TaxID=2962043 RepID=UPI0020B80140|nr:superoxide dismutase [Allokutzneria sp. A3M-2-11 16]MCP3798581.1 superoxide dismutase [Allokutzneria sp. A3M-2-11 16]